MLDRRGFLAAILAAGAAPAIARSGVLMPLGRVGRVWVPPLIMTIPFAGPMTATEAKRLAQKFFDSQTEQLTDAMGDFFAYGQCITLIDSNTKFHHIPMREAYTDKLVLKPRWATS
jgi:hypothetical protein